MITAPLTHAPRIAFALAFAVVLAVSLMAGSLLAGAEPGLGTEQQIRPQPARIHWKDDLHGEVQDVTAGTQFAPDPSTAVGIWAAPGPDRVWVCLRPRSGLQVSTAGWKPVTGGNWRAAADDPYWCTSARTGSDVRFELAEAGDR